MMPGGGGSEGGATGSSGGGDGGGSSGGGEIKFKKLKIKQQKIKVMGKIHGSHHHRTPHGLMDHLIHSHLNDSRKDSGSGGGGGGSSDHQVTGSSGNRSSCCSSLLSSITIVSSAAPSELSLIGTTSTQSAASAAATSCNVIVNTQSSSSSSSSAAASSSYRIEFGDKDLLLSSLMWAVTQSIGTTQTPLPPFLVPDHFKSTVKYSIKGSSSSSFLPSIAFNVSEETLITVLSNEQGASIDASLVSSLASVPVTDPSSFNKETLIKKCVPVPMSLPSWIKVKEYAPIVFACLRDKVYPFPSKRLFASSLMDVVRGPPSHASFTECSMVPVVLVTEHHQQQQQQQYTSGHNTNQVFSSADQQILIKSIDGNDVEGLLSLMKSLHPYLVQRKSHGSLLPQYLAVFRIAHHSLHHHHHHVHVHHHHPVSVSVSGGSNAAPVDTSGATTIGSLLAQTGASVLGSVMSSESGSVLSGNVGGEGKGGGGKGSSSGESSTYLLLVRNPISCNESFFPIHDLFVLSAEGIICHRVHRKRLHQRNDAEMNNKIEKDFVLNLKKEDADRLISNLESDLKFLSTHLLTGYTVSVGIHSIDQWEQDQLLDEEEEEEDDDEGEEYSEDPEAPEESISQQLAGLAMAGSRGGSKKKKTKRKSSSSRDRNRNRSDEEADDDGEEDMESTAVVIDPVRHPFAVPSPCVGVESRASSRPSLHSSDTQDSGFQLAHQSSSNVPGGRFVYFIGVNDLLPLSSSFSSKEQDLSTLVGNKKGGGKEGGKSGAADDAAGKKKKESAREYSRNLMSHISRRILLYTSGTSGAGAGEQPQQQSATPSSIFLKTSASAAQRM